MNTAANIINHNVNSLNSYQSDPSYFKSLHLEKINTENKLGIYKISVHHGIFRYLLNTITWYFKANDVKENLKEFKTLVEYKSIADIINNGGLPYIKQIDPYPKVVELYQDNNTPDHFQDTTNIAVYGKRKSGKSSLIKKLQNNVKTEHERTKPIPSTKNHFTKPTQRYLLNENITLCELPAPGAKISCNDLKNVIFSDDSNTYIKQTKILKYDAIVFNYCDLFNADSNLFEITKLANTNHIPCHFVRNKKDHDMENTMYDDDLDRQQAEILTEKESLNEFMEHMEREHQYENQELHLVSCRYNDATDIQNLLKRLCETTKRKPTVEMQNH